MRDFLGQMDSQVAIYTRHGDKWRYYVERGAKATALNQDSARCFSAGQKAHFVAAYSIVHINSALLPSFGSNYGIFTSKGIHSLSALDACEPQVLRALQKDRWAIVNKPFAIRTNERTVYADCLLERKHNGQSEQAIILEVKCFSNPQTDLTEFYTAVGQYQFYRAAVMTNQSTTPVYLAIPDRAYVRLIKDNAVKIALSQSGIKLVVIDIVKEEVVKWLP